MPIKQRVIRGKRWEDEYGKKKKKEEEKKKGR